MLNTKKKIIPALVAFILVEVVLGIFIQFNGDVAYWALTLSAIVVAFVFVALCYRKTLFSSIMLLALFMTVLADLFLTGFIKHADKQFMAMCFFCVVQGCYCTILTLNQTKKQRIKHLSIRGGVSVATLIITILVMKENANALVIISTFYFANLVTNLVYGYLQIKISILLPIGLTFFMLCDILIGLDVLQTIMTFPPDSIVSVINGIGFNLAWAFYVPAQTLLGISSVEKILKN